MSHTSVPDATKVRLWVLAGGRCEYESCNTPLWRDDLTLTEMNAAYVAHIVADSPKGPRGDAVRSAQLAKDIANLMLLCDKHHRLIDHEGLADHPEGRLLGMKKSHEQRIEHATAIQPERKTHVLLYGANIGEASATITFSDAYTALVADGQYPATTHPIIVSMVNSQLVDSEALFWTVQEAQVRRVVEQQLLTRIRNGEINQVAVFALAPQPLLMLLGYLMSELVAADVFQLHKDPRGWAWAAGPDTAGFAAIEPSSGALPALVLSVSGTITDDRVHAVLGKDAAIWKVTVPSANNDLLKSRNQLAEFRNLIRGLFDRIKARHGQETVLNVFPALPVSAAVEFGRCINRKADMPMRIYDQQRHSGGFIQALDLAAGN